MNQRKVTAEVGTLFSGAAFAISLALPALLGPRVSWEEAALGYIPAGIALVAFRLLALYASTRKPNDDQQVDGSSRASVGRAVGQFVAIGALLAGGCGAVYLAVSSAESRQVARDVAAQAAKLNEQADSLKAKGVAEDDPQLSDVLKELEWTDPAHYDSEANLFRNCAAACAVAAAGGAAWLVRSTRGRKR